MKIVVAIDGPAGAGKSTVTQRVAAALGYRLLDTGALYRTVALVARNRGVAWDDESGLREVAEGLEIQFRLDDSGRNLVSVAGEDVTELIRTPEISDGASRVSALPAVRDALLETQRRLGRQGGVVAEGRDIGTVVFPDAGAKFFLTATAEERARRRHAELRAKGQEVSYDATLAEIVERDERDSERDVAPLAAADDAVVIDSSKLTVEEVVELILSVVREREA